jgi:hypothetical protein
VNRNVDLEKFEDVVKAIYRANQGKSKDDSDDGDEVNLVTMDEDDEKKKHFKGNPCKHCSQIHLSEKVGLWKQTRINVQNGMTQQDTRKRKTSKKMTKLPTLQ